MSLTEQFIANDGTLTTKLDVSLNRLKTFEPEEGYYVAFSGGKDSQCIYHLCEMAGVKFDAHYTVTSLDPPELIYFIREHYPDVVFNYPRDKDGKRVTMWSLIVKSRMPPTRKQRYCCAQLKEQNGQGRVSVIGVRWAESARRKESHGVVDLRGKPKITQRKASEMGVHYRVNKHNDIVMNDDNDESRRLVEQCYRTNKTMINPIIDWTDDEVWEFLNEIAKVPHCSLYDEGFTRLGCIGCPMGGSKNQKREFERWPGYRKLYIRTFDKMLEARDKAGLPTEKWEKNGESVMKLYVMSNDEYAEYVKNGGMMKLIDHAALVDAVGLKCGHCHKRIDKIVTSCFEIDGSDNEYKFRVYPNDMYEETPNVQMYFPLTWTAAELSEHEMIEGIRCPHCGEFPFDAAEGLQAELCITCFAASQQVDSDA